MNRVTATTTIRQIEFELERAEHGMALPYDADMTPSALGSCAACSVRRASGNCPRSRRRDGSRDRDDRSQLCAA